MLVYLFEAAQLYYLYQGCLLNDTVHLVWAMLLILYFCFASTTLFKISIIIYTVVNNVPSPKQNTCNNQEILIVYLAIVVYSLAMLLFLVFLIIKLVFGNTKACSVCKMFVELDNKAHYSVFSCCKIILHTKCNPRKDKAKCPSCIKQCAQCNEEINRKVDEYYWHRKCLSRFHNKCLLQTKKCPKCYPAESEISVRPEPVLDSKNTVVCILCKQQFKGGQPEEDFYRCEQCFRKGKKSNQLSQKDDGSRYSQNKEKKGIVIEKIQSNFFGSKKTDESHVSLNPLKSQVSSSISRHGSKISRIYKNKKRTSQIE